METTYDMYKRRYTVEGFSQREASEAEEAETRELREQLAEAEHRLAAVEAELAEAESRT